MSTARKFLNSGESSNFRAACRLAEEEFKKELPKGCNLATVRQVRKFRAGKGLAFRVFK
jgi:hypothetical protein